MAQLTLAAVQQAAQTRRMAEQDYRSAILASVRLHGVTATAQAAGVSRQAVQQLVKRAMSEQDAMRERLAAIDEWYDGLVDRIAATDDPAGLQNDQRIRNGQVKRRAKKGLGRLPTVREEIRDLAESKLLRSLHEHRHEAFAQRVLAELDEAATLRQRLDSLVEAGVF